jgi:hypothetical protein
LNLRKQFNHAISVPHGNVRKRFPAGQVEKVPDFIHERFALGLKKKTADPAIPRVIPSLEPPMALQAVEGPDQNRRLKIGEFCQMHLSDSLVIDQEYEHPALH